MELTWGGLVFWVGAWGGVVLLSGFVVKRLFQARVASSPARDPKNGETGEQEHAPR